MGTMMATAIALAMITGGFAVSTAVPASAATVITKNGSYEGGCSGSSCLYKPMKKKAPKSKK
jgi:hypothetical protein